MKTFKECEHILKSVSISRITLGILPKNHDAYEKALKNVFKALGVKVENSFFW